MNFLKDKYNFRIKKFIEKYKILKEIIEEQREDFNKFNDTIQYM